MTDDIGKSYNLVMRHKIYLYSLPLLLIGFIGSNIAYAATPTLSLSSSGSDIQISVTGGDPNASVFFYYNINSPSGKSITTVGATDNNGSFSAKINSSLYGVDTGSSIYVIVNGQQSATQTWNSGQNSGNTSTGSFSLGQTSPSVAVGQTVSVSISGGTGYYISNNSNSNIVSPTINNNFLMLYGVATGTASVTICASSGGCSTVSVTVIGASASAVITPIPSSNSDLLATIQNMQSQLVQILSQIQIMATKLSQLALSIKPITPTVISTNSKYQFLNPLAIGDIGADVTELQKKLKAEGIYTGPINGNFGSLTQEAVKKYQISHGLSPLGNIGPATRAALNL